MKENDIRTLRRLLQARVERLPLSRRQIEDRLGIGHGNLNKLFRGQAELHLRHLLAFAELFGVSPGELLEAGCPETTAAATRTVEDVLAEARRGREPEEGRAVHWRMPATAEELTDLLRKEIRRELAARGLDGPSTRPGGEPEGSD
ncbi:MAG TPA: helix-turn-helix transcriptional regulator [Thermoanaerobaculia bacterium]|nr:helix-turn-helix transcriptional regulator [Thermoanaerobaculia bacterium]